MRLRHFVPAALLALLAACGGNPPPGGGGPGGGGPDPAPIYQFTVSVSEEAGPYVAGAAVAVRKAETSAGSIESTATTNVNGFAEFRLPTKTYAVTVTAEGFSDVTFNVPLTRHTRRAVRLIRTAPPVTKLTTSGKIFLQNGQPWRWKGVTAFKVCRLHADGQDIQPFLDAYKGFNVLRVFDYAVVPNLPAFQWESPSISQTAACLDFLASRGYYTELVLLTDDNPARVQHAKDLVKALAWTHQAQLLPEIGNEPNTNKSIDTSALRSALEASGLLFSSGDYDDSPKFFGSFLTYHSARDSEWPRKAHDAVEYYGGGGPNAPTDPAHPVPGIADEPIRPDQAQPPPVGDRRSDFLAYFATAALLGAGGTFHCETCKYGNLPTADEQIMRDAALEGLTHFPNDAPIAGPYERIDEQGATLRTYKVGPHIVRIRPTDGRVFP